MASDDRHAPYAQLVAQHVPLAARAPALAALAAPTARWRPELFALQIVLVGT